MIGSREGEGGGEEGEGGGEGEEEEEEVKARERSRKVERDTGGSDKEDSSLHSVTQWILI